MKFKTLEVSELKDKYFYRTANWDWLTHHMIHVYDNNSPRIITMDYWPQKIFLEATGQITVSELIHSVASKYPSTGIPKNLDLAIIEELESLVNDLRLISLSVSPVELSSSILNPLTEEGTVDMMGTWNGSYTYDMPEEYKDEKTQKVEFKIIIKSIHKNQFTGTVEDNILTGGTPGVGSIIGNFDDYELTFEKNMPIYTRIERNGSHTIDKNKKHPAIIYSGEFSRNKRIVTGSWIFKKKVLIWKGIIPYWIYPAAGFFSMEKENNA